MRRRVRKLKGKMCVVILNKRVRELIDIEAPNLLKSFQDSILKTCDGRLEVCGKKLIQKNKGGAGWWNKEVRNVVTSKQERSLRHYVATDQKKIGPTIVFAIKQRK